MIGKEAVRALQLITGIDMCKQADADFWRGMVTRIVYDLDEEPGAERMMVRVRELLGKMWDELPDKPRESALPETDGQLPLPGVQP